MKTVLLPIGAVSTEVVEMELYENTELQVTSYLPKDATAKRTEHKYFTEWRFTEPQVPESTFYSFGKLKESFPFENAQEVILLSRLSGIK